MRRLSLALFLVQAGFHGFTASIPLALARAGRPDAEIGAIVGTAALIQVPAALVAGALVDRFGGLRLFVVGGVAYLAATLVLLLPELDPSTSSVPFIVARILQGVGFGMTLPSTLSVIPRLVPAARRGVALATAGASHNLTLVVVPPLSIAVLDRYGLAGVCVLVASFVALSFVVAFIRPIRPLPSADEDLGTARRKFGFAYRRAWLGPLAIVILFVAHWGVITAYLPQRADAAGADIGLFFAADGLFVLLARLPSGWLSDRVPGVWQVLAGLAMTALGVLLVMLPLSTPLLALAGFLTGAGAALIVTPLMLALTERSSDADRGSAFALFSASFAIAIALGSIGTAPLIEGLGFEVLLSAALAAVILAGVVALADRGLRAHPVPAAAVSASEPPASTPLGS
ncbi:MAG: MFS transporter [Chloroflexota bacterium]